jgi:hypothetical protein
METSQKEEKLKAQKDPEGRALYEGATANAQASIAAGAAAEPEVLLQERYARRSLELLEKARLVGWFSGPQRIKQLKEDKSFVPPPRDDFKPFVDELQRFVDRLEKK